MKKKLISLILAGVMALSLAGCSNGKSGSSAAGGSSSEASKATSTASSGSAADSSKASAGASGKKYLIVTDTTFAPFEFESADGKMVGIDMDIVAAIAKDQGFDYEVNPLGFSAALAALDAGQADGMIAGMSITDERKQKFDFSAPYIDADVTMAVAADSDITSYDGLKGKNVAIKTGTNGGDFAKSIKDKYGFTVTEFEDSSNMYQDVIVGNSVACFEDYPVMAYTIQQGRNLKIPEGIREAGSSYGFAVKKGENAELLEKFNTGLENIKKNGKLQEIVDSYTK